MTHSFYEIFSNKIIGLSIFSCFFAQLLKVVFNFIMHKKWKFTLLIETGGMPSSHSSFVATLTTCVGLLDGFNSSLFAACFVLSLIVMYDASGVRKAVGEQAKILNKIVYKLGNNEQDVSKELKELVGHTKPEVLVGAVLGILIGMLCLM